MSDYPEMKHCRSCSILFCAEGILCGRCKDRSTLGELELRLNLMPKGRGFGQ